MVRILVSALFALSLSAEAQRILLDPPGPTSATPVTATLYVTCDPESHTLERLGNVIKIHVTPGSFAALCDPPVAVPYAVSLGVLPAGEYRIDVLVGALDSVHSKSFVVRNAAEGAFAVRPATVPQYALGLPLRIDASNLPPVTKIVVGGVTIAPEQITGGNGVYTFDAPQHAPGLVDVTIETAGGATHTLPKAIYYYSYDRVDDSVFERVLFPVLFRGAGAQGSQWVTEVAIDNPTPWTIKAFNDISPLPPCPDCGIGQLFDPNDYRTLDGGAYPHGRALLLPRGEADDLGFSLRVRDTSRAAQGYGTQVPVVREKDMFRNTDLTLLNVPVDMEHRTKLRIYAFDTGDHDAQVTVHRTSAPNVVAAEYAVPMRRSCERPPCEAAPWYGELDLPYDASDPFANVYVTVGYGEVPAWAFASVTNNETQQVTIVTADGKGGRP